MNQFVKNFIILISKERVGRFFKRLNVDEMEMEFY